MTGLVSLLILKQRALSGTITSEGGVLRRRGLRFAHAGLTGGPTCGVATGKKQAKKVSKGTVTGTVTIS